MGAMEKIQLSKTTLTAVNKFIEKYGNEALISALQDYDLSRQVYIYQTKSQIQKIPLSSIDYIEIFGHKIVIHTPHGNLKKYGTLKNEYAYAKKLGFVKCNQSILVPINKIAEINGKDIIITTGEKFALSRSCAANVVSAYINK